MDKFLGEIKKEAARNPLKIGFPEAEEEIILNAVKKIVKEKTAKVVLIGRQKIIKKQAKKLRLNLKNIEIFDPKTDKNSNNFAEKLYKIRQKKGLKFDQAKKLIQEPIYFATMLLHENQIQGIVSGARHPTAHTLRPALQIIKCKKGFKKVSGISMLPYNHRIVFFSDTGVQVAPDKNDLAEIAIESAKTAQSFNIKPRVAMLSFSTHGSANHKNIEKIASALQIIKKKMPKLIIDGEMQSDAALVPEIANIKSKTLKIKGDANVLIFPNLESANISYKLAKIFGNVPAVGPIIQGLKKPVNDLSRGCNIDEIVSITAITVIQAQKLL